MIRHASGISPEELSILDATIAGNKAGFLGQSNEMNPYAPSPEHDAWEKARKAAEASFLVQFARA